MKKDRKKTDSENAAALDIVSGINEIIGLENIVADISAEFSRIDGSGIDELIGRSLVRIAEFHGVDTSFLFLVDSGKSTMVNAFEWCSGSDHKTSSLPEVIPLATFPWALKKLKDLDVIHLPSIELLPAEAEVEKRVLDRYGIKALLVVPLTIRARLTGFFGFGRKSVEKDWPGRDIMLIHTMSGIFASAMNGQMAEDRRRQAEEKYRSLFNHSKDMVYIASVDGTIIEINRAGLELLGFKTPEEIKGQNISEFYVLPEIRKHYDSCIAQQGFVRNIEIPLVRNSGEIIYGLETSDLFTDEVEGGQYIRGIIRDVSDKMRLEEVLSQKTVELEKSNQTIQKTQATLIRQEKMASIGQLAAGVAHEINNPLGFVASNYGSLLKYFQKLRDYTEQVSAGATELGNRELLEMIEKQRRKLKVDIILEDIDDIFRESQEGFERIKAIVQNLKTFSRIDPGNDMEKLDLNDAIDNTLIVARNEIKYVAEVEKTLGDIPMIKGYKSELNQVFLNIIVNAAHAIADKDEKGIISVKTYAAGSNVICEISDTGTGIPEEAMLQIWDPFFTTKEQGKGTGLGLYISYDIIVNKHHGNIDVHNRAEGGATFTISLPVEQPVKNKDA